jgi:hypothetical protein
MPVHPCPAGAPRPAHGGEPVGVSPAPAGIIAAYNLDSISVIVTRPAGGEILSYREPVTWTAIHPDPDPLLSALLSIDLHYSGDDGFTWESIATSEQNDGMFIWDVRDALPGEGYIFRVTATDTAGVSGFGFSDSAFTISDRILITDKKGKRWDITHAVNIYDMQPEGWQQGIGQYAIMPINDPSLLSPGEPGYPAGPGLFLVVGAVFPGGDARAYSIPAIYLHEVVNDRSGDLAFAAVY